MTQTFQRARTEEQRETRRRAILDTTAAMLEEMPVADITLTEMSRRVGLAKSNVLRYFESREAVLLELLDASWSAWLDQLPALLQSDIDPAAPAGERARQFGHAVASSLDEHRTLCDLLSTQAAVLERNVSATVAASYKRTSLGHVERLATIARTTLPELSTDSAQQLCAMAVLAIGAVWVTAAPSAGMAAAYELDPTLAAYSLQFAPMTEAMISTLALGWLAANQ